MLSTSANLTLVKLCPDEHTGKVGHLSATSRQMAPADAAHKGIPCVAEHPSILSHAPAGAGHGCHRSFHGAGQLCWLKGCQLEQGPSLDGQQRCNQQVWSQLKRRFRF